MSLVNYIDLSSDDTPIQLHQAKAEQPELRGIIARATSGTKFVDPSFADLRARAKEVGLKFSAYHYLTPNYQARDQWDFFEQTVGDRSDIEFIALDVEQNYQYSNWAESGSHLCAARAVNWLRSALGTGHQTCLYMDEAYWLNVWPIIEQNLTPDESGSIVRWVAKYASEPTVPYDLWQFTDSGTIGGATAIDCNQVNPNGRLA